MELLKPLERIYANFNKVEKDRTASSEIPEFKEVTLPHGRIITRRDGDNYIIERILSTDMKDYLNMDYSPGKLYGK